MKLSELITNNWKSILSEEFDKDYFKALELFINKEYQDGEVYPEYENIFSALNLTDYDDVSVVIIGQDPYHNPFEAHGLAFSVKISKYPASLKNIFKELKNDLGIDRVSGDLTDWAKQGVFLLNTVLTVEKDKANSHKDIGWEIFTDFVIKQINDKLDNVVFVLWGRQARDKKRIITNPSHFIIESAHPSPLSAYNGFFGSKPFSKANEFLKKNNKGQIKF